MMSRRGDSLLGGSGSAAALSTRGGRGRAASCGVRQEGQPLSTLGPQVSPTAVSCTTQVQSSTVVVARTSQSFIRDRAAAAAEEGGNLPSLSPPGAAAALPPDATFHPMDHGPTSGARGTYGRRRPGASEARWEAPAPPG